MPSISLDFNADGSPNIRGDVDEYINMVIEGELDDSPQAMILAWQLAVFKKYKMLPGPPEEPEDTLGTFNLEDN